MEHLHKAHAPAQDLLAEELARCSDCARTPLIGEHVYLYERAELVCELCRMLRPGKPIRGALVSHRLGAGTTSDPAQVVRITRLIRPLPVQGIDAAA